MPPSDPPAARATPPIAPGRAKIPSTLLGSSSITSAFSGGDLRPVSFVNFVDLFFFLLLVNTPLNVDAETYRVTKTLPDDVMPAPLIDAGIFLAFISETSSLATPIGSSGIQTGRVFS